MSQARSDLVALILELVPPVALVGTGAVETAANCGLTGVSGFADGREFGETADDFATVLWMADAVSVLPRPSLDIGLGPGSTLVVEATLAGDDSLIPVLIHSDVVVLRTRSGATYNRVELRDGSVRVSNIEPWPLSELKTATSELGLELVKRKADTYGGSVGSDPCAHLSWFRNESLGTGRGTNSVQ
jgi:hypothetical protein